MDLNIYFNNTKKGRQNTKDRTQKKQNDETKTGRQTNRVDINEFILKTSDGHSKHIYK